MKNVVCLVVDNKRKLSVLGVITPTKESEITLLLNEHIQYSMIQI